MSEPIRVLHVVTHMNRGGLETMIMNYYRHIDRRKIQFDFLTHRDEKKDYDDEIEELGGKIYHLPPLNPFDKKGYLKKLDEFFQEHKEYKIVHSHLDCMSAIPLKYAKKYGVPVRIAHAHSTSQDKNIKLLIKNFYKLAIKNCATKLFACSLEAGQWMFGKQPDYVINNAVDAQKFEYNSEVRKQVKKELNLEAKFIIGHVGRFCEPKNHMFLLEIFKTVLEKNPQAILVLVGAKEGELYEQVYNKASNLGIENQIKFLGKRTDIDRILQAMDIFVFPSVYEGFPVTLVEAQAAGLPCVVSDVITREVDLTGNVKFCSLNDNVDEWYKNIEQAVNNNRISQYKKICENNYDIKANAKWLQEYYMQVIR